MSEKRKDKNGVLLRDGESQRSDGRYQYRYTDLMGERRTFYANTLDELRKTEKKVQKMSDEGLHYTEGLINILELVDRYLVTKQGVRYNTRIGYNFVTNLLKKEEFCYRKVKDIRVSDAKAWMIKLHDDGRHYSTLCTIKGVVGPAFDMAVEEDIIRKNPFKFGLTKVVPNDSETRIALDPEQLELWMDFIRNDSHYRQYYDEFVVLLGTGMRISEFCGLTKKDLDFEERKIRVERQLIRDRHSKYYVEAPKTRSGSRWIPMTDEVYEALLNIVEKRPKVKVEYTVQGCAGFLTLDKEQKPRVALHYEHVCKWAMVKYRKYHPDKPLPNITPHVFRHTFCTDLANAGLDIKSLQYIMGHSDANITMNVYTHARYDHAAEEMLKFSKTMDRKGKSADI